MSDYVDPEARRLPRNGDEPAHEPDRAEEPESEQEPTAREPDRPSSAWEREPAAHDPDPASSPWEPEPARPPWEPEPPREQEPVRSPWDPEPTPSAREQPSPRTPSPWESEPGSRPAEPDGTSEPSAWDREPPREPPPWPADTWRPQPAPEPEPEYHGLNPLVRLGVPQPWRTIIDWIVTIAGAIAIVLAIKAWVVNPYRIPSSSMEPTLHCARPGSLCTARFSDRVLACRFCYRLHDPRRGDIVVFNVPDKAKEACGAGGVFVKRIVGLPGDLWQEKDGYVYLNGKRFTEPYIKAERRDFQSYPAQRIRPGHYFMMGDNRQSSCDSRRWGTVPRKSIIGRVFAIYWPPQRINVM